MTLNMGEIVTVTKHDHEGRILEFVKTPIPLGTAEELKAAALIESERKKDIALLRETKALVATARAVNQAAAAKSVAPAATQVDDKPTLQEPALPIKSVRQAPLPAPPVQPQLAKRSIKPKVDLLDPRFASLMQAWAERDGGSIGNSIIAQSLAPHEDCPQGSRADIREDDLDRTLRSVLEQLDQQNFLPVKAPESRDAFVRAFRVGADAAIADFNKRRANTTQEEEGPQGEVNSGIKVQQASFT